MKIVVYGGTGLVGSRIVAEALSRGHEVTAVTRSGTQVEGATAVAAALDDTDTLVGLGADADAIVLSIPPDRTGGPAQPTIEAHQRIIAAAPQTRLFVVGGAGSLNLPGGGGLLKESDGFPAAYYPEADAFTTILGEYRASSGLDWVLLSPAPLIAPGERTGRFRLGGDEVIGDSVSAEDFAVAAIDELETPAHRNTRFTVAN